MKIKHQRPRKKIDNLKSFSSNSTKSLGLSNLFDWDKGISHIRYLTPECNESDIKSASFDIEEVNNFNIFIHLFFYQ